MKRMESGSPSSAPGMLGETTTRKSRTPAVVAPRKRHTVPGGGGSAGRPEPSSLLGGGKGGSHFGKLSAPGLEPDRSRPLVPDPPTAWCTHGHRSV